jgi:transposase InsO family protein
MQLIPIEQYALQVGKNRRTLELQISAGKLKSTKQNGNRMIIVNTPDDTASKSLTLEQLCAEKIIEVKMKVSQQGHSYIPKALAEISKFETTFGVKLRGVSQKTLYALVTSNPKNKRTIEKKVRKDSLEIRNPYLKKHLEFIVYKAKPIYGTAAKQNIKLTISMLQEIARLNLNDTFIDTEYDGKNKECNGDKFRDILKIPYGTMWRRLDKEFQARGVKEHHKYYNHKGLYRKDRALMVGAHTDAERGFMDRIVGDGRKVDVHKIPQYNELRDTWEDKTVYTYFWIEERTQRILSYIIKTSEITVDDLKMTFLQAVALVGRPNISVKLDNGAIESSKEFKAFMYRMEIPIEYCRPYHSDDKAMIERIFRYMKDEFDIFLINFTGSNHKKEGRHRTLSLSPAKANYTIDEYIHWMGQYINNWFETRERERTINGKKEKISIRDYFNREWKNHTFNQVSAKQMRFAYMIMDEAPKKFNNKVKFRGEQYTPEEYMGFAFNNHHYHVAYNPNDLEYIDLYAAESFEDKLVIPPKKYLKNQFIMTCRCTRSIPYNERKAFIAKYKQKAQKKMSELSALGTDIRLLENPALIETVHGQYDENGNKINIRKAVEKEVKKNIMEAIPRNRIDEIIQNKTGLNVSASQHDSVDMDDFQNDLDNLEL